MTLGNRRILQFDSLSIGSMGQKRFKDFFDRSVKLLAEEMGIDPLHFYKNDGG